MIQAARKTFKFSPNRIWIYEVLVTGPDALPLSYRRLVRAKDTKLGSCDKHAVHCSEDYRTSSTHCFGSNRVWMILCPLIEALLWPPLCFRFEVGQSRSSSHSYSRLEQIARFSRLTCPPNFERASEHPEATTTRVKNFWAHFGANRSQVSNQFLEWTIIIKRLVPKAVFFVAKKGEAQKCFLFLGSQ